MWTRYQFLQCNMDDLGASFFGCCKSIGCNGTTCPDEDFMPAFVNSPEMTDIFGYLSINNTGVAPVTTSSIALAGEPAMTSAPVYDGLGSGASKVPYFPVSICRRLCHDFCSLPFGLLGESYPLVMGIYMDWYSWT